MTQPLPSFREGAPCILPSCPGTLHDHLESDGAHKITCDRHDLVAYTFNLEEMRRHSTYQPPLSIGAQP